MRRKRKLHPIARLNFVPRIIACTFYVLIIGSISWESLLSLQFITVAILGGGWPHLALFLSSQRVDSKRQEEVNIHLDTIFCGVLVVVYPAFAFVSTVNILLITNGLFIGSFRLLGTTLVTFFTTALISYLLIKPDYVIDTGFATDIIIFLFFCSYFGCFAYLGNNLTRQLIKLNKEVKSLSIKDPLTQCFNRLYLDKKLVEDIQRCYRMNYPLSIIFADLDNFKLINDQYGHSVGDAVLQKFVEMSQRNIREDADWVARFGGEEFVFILSNSDKNVALVIAERIRMEVSEQPFVYEDIKLNITCSFGVASIDPKRERIEANDLITIADKGLYTAKKEGRNCVRSL